MFLAQDGILRALHPSYNKTLVGRLSIERAAKCRKSLTIFPNGPCR